VNRRERDDKFAALAHTIGQRGHGHHPVAIAYTLTETCKLKCVNPQAWLAWVLEPIQDHPAHRIGELMPWE
jgi:hypothetical protein